MAQPEPRNGDEGFPAYQPTPTQAENDQAAVGDTPLLKERDGSHETLMPEPPDAKAIKAKLLLLALATTPHPPTK